jgi:tetratricopeptide (TPR) repeat protein
MSGPARELERHLAAHPSSPLFARFAETLLRTGEISRALDLCETGLQTYPDYPTGMLVYARCLAARGERIRAAETLSRVISRYPDNIVLEQFGEEFSEAVREPVVETPVPGETSPPGEAVTGVTRVSATESSEADDDTLPRFQASAAALPEPRDTVVKTADAPVPDDAIIFLGGEPLAAPPMKSPTGFIEQDRIISRTLAEIYASQGAVREAVETYRLLLRRLPGKREEYGGRLKELEERLRDDPDEQRQPSAE